ncbi:preprotein translocase subunit SecA [Leifsonia xyli subsp. cynodontis DSM 46306]|jgi:hypothetical protein|uniref:Uncharacterized protein n=1 Tax=Leifsonia xyli subsp. cynodontis DSM 46306 TaxID=1389489 RepID=U3P5F8_LEIXC|nr:preprotein translocase subunit SecA [Leifsonia xyli subsp. cynodontis DSM 46306]
MASRNGVPGGGATLVPHEQPGGDRSAGAGHARDERERLREAEDDAVAPGQLAEAAGLRAHPVRDAQQDAEDDERDGDDPERAESGLDRILERQAEDDDRNAAQDDQPAHPGVRVATRHPAGQRLDPARDDPRDVAPEVQQHGGLRAELDDRGEAGARVPARAQQLTDDADVRARGDGQELGESLDEAQDEGVEEVHASFQ